MGEYCPDFCVRNRPASTYWHVNCQIMNYHAISDSLASMLMLLLHHVHVKIRGEHVALRAATRSTHPDAREHQRAPAKYAREYSRQIGAHRPNSIKVLSTVPARPRRSLSTSLVKFIFYFQHCAHCAHTHTQTLPSALVCVSVNMHAPGPVINCRHIWATGGWRARAENALRLCWAVAERAY